MSSRYWRTLASNFVVGVALEYALCLAVSLFILETDQAVSALLMLLGLWLLQIVIGLKNLAVSALSYYLFRKARMVQTFEHALNKEGFPIDEESFMPDAVDYMMRIAKDPQSSRNQAITAAEYLGTVETMKYLKPSMAWQFMSAMEVALDRHRYQLRRSSVSDTLPSGV